MKLSLSLVLAALTASLAIGSAEACTVPNYIKIKNVKISADGVITRTAKEKKIVRSGFLKLKKKTVWENVVRDSVKLERDDRIVMNVLPSAVDSTMVIDVTLITQEKDSQGIFSTKFDIIERTTFTFGGATNKVTEQHYRATLHTNYEGKGIYNEGCGSVEIEELAI